MAVLYITEFCYLASELSPSGDTVQCPFAPGLAEQHIAIGATTAPSAAFNVNTTFIQVHADVACNLAFSETNSPPTAVTTAHLMGAGETRFYGVRGGGTMAVIAAS